MRNGLTTEQDRKLPENKENLNKQKDNHGGGKFLTFFLGNEEYGLEILKVHEIIGIMPITPVPRTPSHIRGVINLRGKIISIMELRQKFGMVSIEQTDESCIIVVQTNGIQTGIIVDRVSEVLNILQENIEAAPDFGTGINTDYILGMGKSDGRVKLLLDIDKVLSSQDIAGIKAFSESSAQGAE